MKPGKVDPCIIAQTGENENGIGDTLPENEPLIGAKLAAGSEKGLSQPSDVSIEEDERNAVDLRVLDETRRIAGGEMRVVEIAYRLHRIAD